MTHPHRFFLTLVLAVVALLPGCVRSAPPGELPLIGIDDLVYAGAFRLPAATFGASSLNYSEGPLAYDPERNVIFIVGHSHHQAIAEFAVPPLVLSSNLGDLAMASDPLQPFAQVLGRTPDGNPEGLDRIGGLALLSGVGGPQLLVNAYEYYDAPGDNRRTSLLLRDPSDLAGSPVDGFFAFQGGAGHTSGWLSPIPAEWQELLGGSFLTGQSSGIPIISRTSVGPSAFAFDPQAFADGAAVPDPVPTTTLLDFSLDQPLHSDLDNSSGDNDLWTHLSRVTYGLIVPGTRSYLTVGYSGGHASGVCYKCTQDNGNLCGGYCAPAADDYASYYWLWDLSDLLAVKNGELEPSAVRPYAYGPFSPPFSEAAHQLGGGAFDPDSGLLYLTVQRADRAQGTYANPPVVVAYRLPGSN